MSARDPIPVYKRFATAPDPESYMRACWTAWLRASAIAGNSYLLAIKKAKTP